jgi:hypothetical protein
MLRLRGRLGKRRETGVNSDEVARAFRDAVARDYEMMFAQVRRLAGMCIFRAG